MADPKTNGAISIDSLVPKGLPDGRMLVERGRERARAIDFPIGRYPRLRGVRSDREYKERCRGDGTITTYINLGFKTWGDTKEAIEYIQAKGHEVGFELDRVSLIPDRRMGLPPELRSQALEETGIMMYSQQDWDGASEDVDIAPVWNDHNLGSPGAIVNTEAALRAGFGYIGNVAQHNYGYPLWDDDAEQMARTIEAIGMIAAKRDDGVVLEAYVEDGYCAGFHDAATSLGWCLFHRYVVEDLIGAAHSQSYGSTFQDPLLKQAFGLALDAINVHRVPPSFTHGDTNSFTTDSDLDRNAAIVFNDVYFTAMRELRYPTGGALHATPVTEALRIPTEDEIVQSLVIVSEAVNRARANLRLMNWLPVIELRDKILQGGRKYYANLMRGLESFGVDVGDPLQCILATRRIGGGKLEELFGVGEPDDSYPRGFAPFVPTDTLRRLMEGIDAVLGRVQSNGSPDLRGLKALVASGDIHEFGLFVVSSVLQRLGAEVIDLGTSIAAPDLAKVAHETSPDVVALSTYNGMALSLGRQVLDELGRRNVNAEVFLGGRLNEDVDGESAVDVTDQLNAIGVHACATLDDMIESLSRRTPAET
jgi:methylmalonyl-CoA mutase cobalamin-binding subunit